MTTPTPRPRRVVARAALALVAVLAVVGVAACSGSPSPAPPSSGPSTSSSSSPSGTAAPGKGKPWVVGLMDRKGPPDAAELTYDGKPLVQGFVIQVLWKDVQPTGPDSFDTSAIDRQLAFAKAHGLAVRMRVYAGYNSPSWVLQQAGSVTWQGAEGNAGPSTYPVPVFWGSAFQSLFQQFDAKLAAKYDADPQLREVVPGMCITNFAEPFQRQFSDKANVAAATAKGYTDAADQSCLRRTVTMFAQDWRTTNLAMAFNPYQSIDKKGANDKSAASAQASVQVPEQIAQYCVQQLGPRCVLGNNSMKGGSRGMSYDALYSMLQGLHQPIYIQTASNAKIQDWQAALSSSVQLGALSVELPDGYQKWDKATLQAYDARLQANADKLSGA